MLAYHSNIHSFASMLPTTRVSNQDLATFLDTSDEWITVRTGVKYRYRCNESETSFTLALESCKKTIEKSSVKISEIDGIIVGTSTSDYVFPSVACQLLQALHVNGFGFDVQAACSGFVFAAHTAHQFILAGSCQHILVVGADSISRIVDWKDRSTCVLFGDGGGSCLISRSDEKKIMATCISAIEDPDCSLKLVNHAYFPEKTHFVKMDGPRIFKKATDHMTRTLGSLLDSADLDKNEIDLVVPHQANERIIRAVADRAQIPFEKFFVCVDRFGNTSAASIPIAIAQAVEEDRLRPGMIVAVVAFGGGFNAGGQIFRF